MTAQGRKDQIRRMFEEMKRGNIDFVDEVYAENCTSHDPGFPSSSRADMKAQGRQMRAAVPDMHMDVHEILADGDLTAARWTMAGTQRGEVMGIPATGKSFVLSGTMVDKWEGDRIVEEWNDYDMAGLFQQLGLLPDKAQIAKTAAQRATR